MFRVLAASVLLALTTTANAATYRVFSYDVDLDEVIADTGALMTSDSCPVVLVELDDRVTEMTDRFELWKGVPQYVTLTENNFIVFGIPIEGPQAAVIYYLECREDEAL